MSSPIPPSSSLRPHNTLSVPDQNPLIPTTTRRPPLGTKQAPIHARHKLSMRTHAPQLPALPAATHGVPADAEGRPVRPHTAGHVVGGGEQDVGQVRRPGELADGVLVAGEQRERRAGVADVEGADDAVDARGGDDVGAVLVPVVGEGFGGLEGGAGGAVAADGADGAGGLGEGRVDGDRGDEVVGGGGGAAQVEDAEVGVGGDGGEDGG